MAAKDWTLLYIAQNADSIWTMIHWPDGPECSVCHSHNYTILKDGRYRCRECGKIYSSKTDTLFHGSKIPISYWMVALYLMLTGKGISSYELARKIQVTQKTAYYMLMRLRLAFDQTGVTLDGGVVAHDEVYIGGDYSRFTLAKKQALIQRFNLPKKPVKVSEKIALGNAVNHRTKKCCFGMTDGDRCCLIQVPTPATPASIIEAYTKHVSRGGLAVSDCSLLYKDWERLTGRELHTNNHTKAQFRADNGTSSNMIEGLFSWLERSNVFVHVHYSRRLTQLYLDEFAYRYNHRRDSVEQRMRDALQRCSVKYDKEMIDRFNAYETEMYNVEDFFNPVEFFRKNGSLVTEYSEGGLVYRRADYEDQL